MQTANIDEDVCMISITVFVEAESNATVKLTDILLNVLIFQTNVCCLLNRP
jgi:hypothetical protein